MSTQVSIVLGIVIVLGVGLVRIVQRVRETNLRLSFTKKYYNNFGEFCDKFINSEFDQDIYFWLTHRINKMQQELGPDGIAAYYRRPYADHAYNNYPLLINLLPLLRTGRAHREEMGTCMEMMIRHMGVLEDVLDAHKKKLRNPFIWLIEGVNFIVTLPLRIAYWTGLFKYQGFEKATNSFIVHLISFLVTVIGLLSSIVTFFVEWETISRLLLAWLF